MHADLMNFKYIIMCRSHITYVAALEKSYQDLFIPEKTTHFLAP